ncbi:hypothetical protein BTO30_13385 [Domibacillus antri]|uniref:Uncharacterized protein n=1 Tax=Domibacillus antri TaxID=1714264 RepID=A0A1Q8Q320_9BACI|nr:hypothetical protein BTO30_13385 [Domibacillus antri]
MEEEIVMVCPHCQNVIQASDRVGITHIHSVVHFTCGAMPMLGERIIDVCSFEEALDKYL